MFFIEIAALTGDYPAGTTLLQTRLRYGVISYKKKHIVKREGKWKPSERQASELMNRYKSTDDMTVRFVSQGSGGIKYSAFPTPRLRHCFTYCCGRYYSGEDE